MLKYQGLCVCVCGHVRVRSDASIMSDSLQPYGL